MVYDGDIKADTFFRKCRAKDWFDVLKNEKWKQFILNVKVTENILSLFCAVKLRLYFPFTLQWQTEPHSDGVPQRRKLKADKAITFTAKRLICRLVLFACLFVSKITQKVIEGLA